MRIGIIIAMDKELAQMRTLLSNAHTEKEGHLEYILGNIGDKEIIMQKCGIGKVNAAVGATEMIIHYHPDIILSTGCAGGASTSLHVTDVVAGSQYTYHDVYCGSEVSYGQFVGMPAVFPADAVPSAQRRLFQHPALSPEYADADRQLHRRQQFLVLRI